MAKFAITYENETIKYELTFRDKVYDFTMYKDDCGLHICRQRHCDKLFSFFTSYSIVSNILSVSRISTSSFVNATLSISQSNIEVSTPSFSN